MEKSKEIQEMRKLEEALTNAAKAVGKMADVAENENSTELDYEAAMKDVMWRMMILESLK